MTAVAASATAPPEPPAATRTALVASSLCISSGVHMALAAMHGMGASGAAFLAAGLASLAALALVRAGAKGGVLLASFTLAAPAVIYLVSRMVELPIVGRGHLEVLGVVTLLVEISGLVAAVQLRRARPGRAPIAICALIVAFSFLTAFALSTPHAPGGTVHGHDHPHAGGHHAAIQQR